jgi:hypothetical protein
MNIVFLLLNIMIAFVFFSFGYTLEGRAAIADSVWVPAIIIAINMLMAFVRYSHTRFIYTIVDGDPEAIESFGGAAAWKKKMEEINREVNANLRKDGGQPFMQTFQFLETYSKPGSALLILSEFVVGVTFVYAGWFWTGVSTLVAAVVTFQCLRYLVKRLPRIVELAKM